MADPERPHSARPVIILLDPFIDECEMYAHALRMAGFEPIPCEDADTAMATALAEPVCAVLTRILQRGDVDGVEFTRRLKHAATTRHLPVLIISTLTHPRFRRSAEEAGCDAFLLLPCAPEVIVSELHRLIARAARMADDGHRSAITTTPRGRDFSHREPCATTLIDDPPGRASTDPDRIS